MDSGLYRRSQVVWMALGSATLIEIGQPIDALKRTFSYEATISTQQASPRPQSWISQAYGHKRRP
jgi:hypothetical protein